MGSGFNLTVQTKGDQVSIKTGASNGVAWIKSMVYDRYPIAIYAVDSVLEPVELFELVEGSPVPVAADAPKRAPDKSRRRPVVDALGLDDDDEAVPTAQRKNSKKSPSPASLFPQWLASALLVSVAFAAALD